MCGIVGDIGTAVSSETLDRMRDAIAHRGPDGFGSWISDDGRVGIAHRRLSILDLTDAARQPFWDGSHSVGVVFNGEIYNFQTLREELLAAGYSFRSRSDTEVLVHGYRHWGEKVLDRIDGMFVFALFDARAGIVLLARDRMGEKPLYYFAGNGRFVFGSELRSLRLHPAVPSAIDFGSLNHYFARGYVPRDRSMIAGVRKLMPGHLLKLDVASMQTEIRRYWSLPEFRDVGASSGEMAGKLGDLLVGSVRRRLVADVPVGVLLSGGLDSSLVVAAAARAGSSQVRTFTIVHPHDGSFDESERARTVAAAFGTEHTELSADEGLGGLEESLAHCDEPMADSSFLPMLMVSRLARRHVTVALGGDGGDELFAGYAHYRTALRLDRSWANAPAIFRRLATSLGASLNVGTKGRGTLIALGGYDGLGYVTRTSFFDPAARRSLLRPEIVDSLGDSFQSPERDSLWRDLERSSPLSRYTRYDSMTYLPEDILVKVDRASMAASLEVRAPWLDHHIVEFAFGSVPDSMKTNLFSNRLIERDLARRWLPRELETRVKKGFSIPLDRWLLDKRSQDFRHLPAVEGFVDSGQVESLWKGLERGRSNAQRLFALLVLDRWLSVSDGSSRQQCCGASSAR